jgi:hypothetical protein
MSRAQQVSFQRTKARPSMLERISGDSVPTPGGSPGGSIRNRSRAFKIVESHYKAVK